MQFVRTVFPQLPVKKSGMGDNGVTFMVELPLDIQERRTSMTSAIQRLESKAYDGKVVLPRDVANVPPKCVLIKVTGYRDGHHESTVMRMLADAPPVSGVSCISQTLHAKNHIPTFVASASTPIGYVIIMEYVHGIVWADLKKVNVPLITSLQKSIAALWTAGVVHNDLHERNIIVPISKNKLRGPIKIIDFGFAVILPARDAMVLRTRMCSMNTAIDDIVEELQRFQYSMGRVTYHKNVDVMRRAIDALRDRQQEYER
jgi:tRNA A-37 threonylcarbamoyl transferase component Bud32